MAFTVSYFNNVFVHLGSADMNLTTDTYKLMLVNAYTFDGAHDEIADIGAVEIFGGVSTNGYTAGGATLTGLSLAFVGPHTRWDADEVIISASGGDIGPATGAIIYNSTQDILVCYADFGQDETATDGTDFKFTFNENGILVIQPAA